MKKKAISVKKSHPKSVSHPRGHKSHPHYSHSAVLSNNVLMGLAIFFALVGLFVTIQYQKQNEEFERFLRSRVQEQYRYVPSAQDSATPIPEVQPARR